jgi:hypothetical protein
VRRLTDRCSTLIEAEQDAKEIAKMMGATDPSIFDLLSASKNSPEPGHYSWPR